MKNIALYLLWFMVFVLLGMLILFSTNNIKQINEDKNAYIIGLQNNPCYPNGDINFLPDAGNVCCQGNSSLRRFTISNGNLQVLIGQQTLPPVDACKNLCVSYNNRTKTCNDTQANNSEYYKCINLLNPVNNCASYSLPVAQTQNAPFYVEETGWDNCPQTISC